MDSKDTETETDSYSQELYQAHLWVEQIVDQLIFKVRDAPNTTELSQIIEAFYMHSNMQKDYIICKLFTDLVVVGLTLAEMQGVFTEDANTQHQSVFGGPVLQGGYL